MACDCHKSSGNRYEGRVRPDDQCMACAKKHLILARNAWGEFCHEDENREYVAAHIRAAIDHCKRDHRAFAVRLRELAQTIEGARDAGTHDVAEKLRIFAEEARAMYYSENPDARRRLDELAADDGAVDIILPLGKDSYNGQYEEARMLLRSIAANCGSLGRVIVAGVTTPRWLRNCLVVPIPDDLRTNKDGNMLTKVLGAVELAGARRFCVCADDNAFVRQIDLAKIPVITGGGCRSWFESMPDEKRNHWHKRMLLTYDFFKSWGIDENTNYDAAHCPQTFTTRKFAEAIKSIPYRDGLGLGMYACLHMASGERDSVDWMGWVNRAQNAEEAKRPWTAPMLSYNDEAWAGGVRQRLLAMFPEKCRYEEE